MADKNTNHAASSTKQSDAISDQANQDPSSCKPTVLSNARKLVESKTRFESDDIQPVHETEQLQSYEITVLHHLIAEPVVKSITGHFVPQSQDLNTLDPVGDAQNEVARQLRSAAKALQASLAEPKWVYNKVEPGVLLRHPHKHWRLLTCSKCIGSGQVTCHPCGGAGEVTCYQCHGTKRVSCGCMNGYVFCTSCGGTGKKSRQVQKNFPVQVYENGTYRTVYKPSFETVLDTCPSCSFGKIRCARCNATGQIYCPACNAKGKITCSSCAGSGQVECKPCEGSGQVGTAAWVDVQVQPEYTCQLPNGTPPDVMEIAKAEGLHGLPPISERFQLDQVLIQPAENPEVVTASYLGNFKVVRQEVVCQGESAQLVAYGNDLRWWTLDGIIERLLRDDLKALSNAIVESTNEGLFSSRLDHLLVNLKQVAASEINVEIVEAALADKELTEHKGAVSKEYANTAKHGIQVSLRRIYVRTAKRFAWKTSLATLIVGLGVWAFQGLMWAGISVVAVLLLSFMLHRRSIRNLLTDILGTPEFAHRAMKVAAKGSGRSEAALVLSMPAVVLVLAIGWALPVQPPFGNNVTGISTLPTSDIKVQYPSEAHHQSSNKPLAGEPAQTTETSSPAKNEQAGVKGNVGTNPLNDSRTRRAESIPQQSPIPRLDASSLGNNHTEEKLDSNSKLKLHMAEKMFNAGHYKNAYELAKRVLAVHPGNLRAAQIASSAESEIQRSRSNGVTAPTN